MAAQDFTTDIFKRGPYTRRPLEERFWEKVEKTDTCWVWTGGTSHGYGDIFIQPGKHIRTHRLSWTLHFGDIPEGLCVLHHCDNPPCVRPDHLFLGTRADNNHDTHRKGRYGIPVRRKGEQHPHSKLTTDDILTIRALRDQGMTYESIAIIYKVTKSHICHIIKKRLWKHV